MAKVLNKKTDVIPAGSHYVGRPSIFGNPFVIGKDGSRDEVCDKYEKWIAMHPGVQAAAKKQLRGQDLVCWCAFD